MSNNFAIEKSKAKYSTENEYNINRYSKLLRNVDINDFSIELQGKVFVVSFNKNKLNEIDYNSIEEQTDIELVKSAVRGIFMG